MSGNLRRLLETIGLERSTREMRGMRDVTPATATQSHRQLARVILQILAQGVPGGGKLSIEQPGVSTVRFTDRDLAEAFIPDDPDLAPTIVVDAPSDTVCDAEVSPASPSAAQQGGEVDGFGASPPPTPAQPLTVGDKIPVKAGHFLELDRLAPDGQQRYWVVSPTGQRHAAIWGRDAAKAACIELAETGRLTLPRENDE
jgi:hypothetical protein